MVIELMIRSRILLPTRAVKGTNSDDRPGGYEKDAALDRQGFKNVLKLRAKWKASGGGHPPGPEK